MGLKGWAKPKPPKLFSEKLTKRVEKIPSADLSTWVEQALSETSRSLSSYIKTNDNIYLEEMLLGAEALHCLIDSLHNRNVV